MMRFPGRDDQSETYKRPVISPIWLAEKARAKQEAVFDQTVRAFLDRDDSEVEVEYEPAAEGVACLKLAVTRLGLDGTVGVRLDEHGRIIVQKTN